jgi:hypothetical protein
MIQLAVKTIRTLSIDAVQAAKYGHPGTSMALAPLVYTIWNRSMNFDPQDPIWPNRDRFVLSNGHASMLLWSVLHLTKTQAIDADYETLGHPQQISTAGKEASGTGNMKFSMNGALTIGTLDGVNVEIRAEVGPKNFFLFGLTAGEVEDLKSRGYSPRSYYESNLHLREAIDQVRSGHFSRGDGELFRPLLDNLLDHDPFLLLADYQSYIDSQDQVSSAYRDQERWIRMSVLNVARMGKFSSDRSIREYCDHVWQMKPIEERN